jgi:eukaryotic-like serine/threonine-protein kinase
VNRERWEQIDRLFEAVLECPAAERPVFLARVCANDPDLKAELESLLAAHDPQDGFLERPALAVDPTAHTGNNEDELIGQALHGYRILRLLGRGGFGEVYLAEDSRLSRPVAVKLLAQCPAADEDRVRRFRKEALAASALNHPNILTIHEVREWRGRDFIVTEFVDGITLREYMRQGPPPLHVAIDIALQVASALVAAHAAGIVHRDIKPENIMVRPDEFVKVLDFGIAKRIVPNAAGRDTGTAATFVLGTAAYMSPEQARGQPVDGRTDIWSLGVVIYEMTGGRLPFPGTTNGDRIAAILERRPEPLGRLNASVPTRLERIVDRALSKNREARYRNAAEVVKELQNARDELGTSRRRVWLRVRRRQLVCAAGLFVGIACAVPAAYYGRTAIHGTRGSRGASAHDAIHSLAVLPFANESATTDSDYLVDGITDTLIDDLSQIEQLKVASHNAVVRYKVGADRVQETARALGVRAVLTGRVAQKGQNIAVTVELVDAVDNSHIWGEHYERNLANLVNVPRDIASEITERLRLRLSSEERGRLSHLQTLSPEAFQAYLKGRYYWLKRGFPSPLPGSASDFVKSRDFYRQAIEADPAYALAYSGLGHYYAMAAGHGLMRPEDGWPKAQAAFQKAMELDPGLPDIRVGLAVIQWVDRRDWAGAERELRNLLRTTPSIRPEALYARLLAAERRFDEAILQARRAIEFDPLSIRFSSALGDIYFYARRYDESVQQYRQALELDAQDVSVHEAIGNAYEREGLFRKAIDEWGAALRYAGDGSTAAALDRAYYQKGWTAAVSFLGRARLRQYEDLTRRGEFVPAIQFARAYARLGDRERALDSLIKACDEHTFFVLLLNTDPFYDDFRRDARFQAIVSRIQPPR